MSLTLAPVSRRRASAALGLFINQDERSRASILCFAAFGLPARHSLDREGSRAGVRARAALFSGRRVRLAPGRGEKRRGFRRLSGCAFAVQGGTNPDPRGRRGWVGASGLLLLCTSKEEVTRRRAASGRIAFENIAGGDSIQSWIPAVAGMTAEKNKGALRRPGFCPETIKN